MEGDNRWPVNITLFGHCNPGRTHYNPFDMTPKTATNAISVPAASPSASPATSGPITMSIDIGGSGLKAMLLDPAGKPVSMRQRAVTYRSPAARRCAAAGIFAAFYEKNCGQRSSGFSGLEQNLRSELETDRKSGV